MRQNPIIDYTGRDHPHEPRRLPILRNENWSAKRTESSEVDGSLPAVEMALITTSFDAIIDALEGSMRTTVALDDDLVRTAQEFTGVAEKTALLREALKALIERESARRLASLGGTMRELKNVPRRRPAKN